MKRQINQPSLTPEQYVGMITKSYSEAGSPERAEQQSAYLRNLFPYYGLKAPEWGAILKEIFNQYGLYEGDLLFDFVRRCQDAEHREMHYAGLQMLEKKIRRQPIDTIKFLEELTLTNSWWDTVDWINKLVGIHLKRYPELQLPTAEKWIESDNRWLQRLAIIHQLTYKEQTDWELMQRMILRRADSKEFFVQKAAGWALRQYSKTDGAAVSRFVEKEGNGLSPLTNREAMKWLNSNNRSK